MKKISALAVGLLALCAACSDDDKSTWENYADWREANNAWLAQQQARTDADGQPYYRTVVPKWNPGNFILLRYCNDRSETEGNLTPMYTSTVDVRYKLHLYDGTPVDSSTNLTANGPGVYRAQLNSLVPGWAVALSEMRCGDSVEVVIPYALGYGASDYSAIKPYSALRFNIRLVDIYKYETSPN